jgi:hypothetical protein
VKELRNKSPPARLSKQPATTAATTRLLPNAPHLLTPFLAPPDAKIQPAGSCPRCPAPARSTAAACERAHQHTSANGCACATASEAPAARAAASPCSRAWGVGLALPRVPTVRVSGFVCPFCLAHPHPGKPEGRTWTGCGHTPHSHMHTCPHSPPTTDPRKLQRCD